MGWYAFDFFPQEVHDVIFLFEEQTKATAKPSGKWEPQLGRCLSRKFTSLPDFKIQNI